MFTYCTLFIPIVKSQLIHIFTKGEMSKFILLLPRAKHEIKRSAKLTHMYRIYLL